MSGSRITESLPLCHRVGADRSVFQVLSLLPERLPHPGMAEYPRLPRISCVCPLKTQPTKGRILPCNSIQQRGDEALERLALGLYGVCKQCGKKISSARLEAVPHAVACASCRKD